MSVGFADLLVGSVLKLRLSLSYGSSNSIEIILRACMQKWLLQECILLERDTLSLNKKARESTSCYHLTCRIPEEPSSPTSRVKRWLRARGCLRGSARADASQLAGAADRRNMPWCSNNSLQMQLNVDVGLRFAEPHERPSGKYLAILGSL